MATKVSDTRVKVQPEKGLTWAQVIGEAVALGIEVDHVHAVFSLSDDPDDIHIVHFGVEDGAVEVTSQTIWPENGDWQPEDFISISVDAWHPQAA